MQLQLESPQDLRLVLDDQHAGAAHTVTLEGSSTAGSHNANVVPLQIPVVGSIMKAPESLAG